MKSYSSESCLSFDFYVKKHDGEEDYDCFTEWRAIRGWRQAPSESGEMNSKTLSVEQVEAEIEDEPLAKGRVLARDEFEEDHITSYLRLFRGNSHLVYGILFRSGANRLWAMFLPRRNRESSSKT